MVVIFFGNIFFSTILFSVKFFWGEYFLLENFLLAKFCFGKISLQKIYFCQKNLFLEFFWRNFFCWTLFFSGNVFLDEHFFSKICCCWIFVTVGICSRLFRNLPLKFGQNRVSDSWDIPDMDKSCKDKCCLNKCHFDSWNMFK